MQHLELELENTGSSEVVGGLDFEEGVVVGSQPVAERLPRNRDSVAMRIMVWALLLGGLSVLVVRLFYLQISSGQQYLGYAEGNRLRDRVLLAPRGLIVDRFGEVLAQNTTSFRLAVIPADLPQDRFSDLLQQVVKDLGIEQESVEEQVLERLDFRSMQPVVFVKNISKEKAILFQTKAHEYPGFFVQSVPVRDYVSAESFSHVLGITGVIAENDPGYKDPKYVLEDFVGKDGLEAQYESVLKGQNGTDRLEVDSAGRVVKSLGQRQPVPGQTLQLGIDKGLQEVLYREFAARGRTKGAAVAIDVKTGEVRALVSVPGFDSNKFAPGISKKDYQKLLDDTGKPLFNRAIAAQLPPGSTVKMMVGLAALEEGVVKEDTVIVDTGKITVPNQYFPDIKYDFVGWKRTGLGPMTVRSAIARSSDIYFYIVGGGHPSSPVNPLGIDRLSAYYRKFALGRLSGIDLPGEKPGVVADPAWKAEYFKEDPIQSKWYLGNTYHVSIGQGDMLVTPLQVAIWTAAIANNGSLTTPHLATGVLNDKGELVERFNFPELVSEVASLDNFKIIQQAMRQTVLAGSAQQLKNLKITSAGKTGTSQFDAADPNKTHAWFTVYAPYENPEIALTVLVEAGGEGHAVAVPITKAVLEWWSQNRTNPK